MSWHFFVTSTWTLVWQHFFDREYHRLRGPKSFNFLIVITARRVASISQYVIWIFAPKIGHFLEQNPGLKAIFSLVSNYPHFSSFQLKHIFTLGHPLLFLLGIYHTLETLFDTVYKTPKSLFLNVNCSVFTTTTCLTTFPRFYATTLLSSK